MGLINPLNDKQYRELKKLYLNAVEKRKKQFKLGEDVLLVTYAKYLIEYIELIRTRQKIFVYDEGLKRKELWKLKKQ